MSDVKYVASSQVWNRVIPVDHEMVVKLHVSWDRSVTRVPQPAALNINGKAYNCKGSPQTTTPHAGSTTTNNGPSTTTSNGPFTTTNGGPTTPQPTLPPTPSGRGIFASWPNKVLGLYLLLADDYHEDFDSNAQWSPKLYDYQQKGANVLFLTFINPGTMAIPPAFQNLAATRGKDVEGAVPKDTVIIFAIGENSFCWQCDIGSITYIVNGFWCALRTLIVLF